MTDDTQPGGAKEPASEALPHTVEKGHEHDVPTEQPPPPPGNWSGCFTPRVTGCGRFKSPVSKQVKLGPVKVPVSVPLFGAVLLAAGLGSTFAPTAAAAGGPVATPTAGGALTSRTIFWGDSGKVVGATPGAGCQVSWIYTMRITNGARFAGKTARVMLYGPDFPSRPTRSYTVRSDGTFAVPEQAKLCFTGAVEGVALVSVAGNTDVYPRPPAKGGAQGAVSAPATGTISWQLSLPETLHGTGQGPKCEYTVYVDVSFIASAGVVSATIGKTAVVQIAGGSLPSPVDVPLTNQGGNQVSAGIVGASDKGVTYHATLVSVGGKPVSGVTASVPNFCQ